MGITLNWSALGISALGALVGVVAGGVYAGARNRPLGTPLLVGAALGAIAASAASPRALPMQ